MTESDAKNEQPEEPEREFSQEQYDMLKRCSEKGDKTEWNKWREDNPEVEIHLQGAELGRAKLKRADLSCANLQGADLGFTNLQGAELDFADLQGAILYQAKLQGADLWRADLKGTCFLMAGVDGETIIRDCQVDRTTDFTGVGLDSARVEPGLKQLLKYNIRRLGWKKWYADGPWWKRWPKKAFIQPFWWMSDYGRSTGRIVVCFFALAFLFTGIYLCVGVVCYLLSDGANTGMIANLFEKDRVAVPGWLVPWRALYFSIVTMTTLGFGDMYAAPDSLAGHLVLALQVLLGYVLLAALVTRFAVLFQAGGPAGKFARKDEDQTQISRIS